MMSDLMKKGFLLGLGVALSGRERMEKKMDEWKMVDDLSPEQARQAVRRYMEKGEAKREEWDARQREQFDQLLDELGLVRKEELAELEMRIRKLEAQQRDPEL